jgi:tRNA A-37 threonylcarbamoyl transferase component Bud32
MVPQPKLQGNDPLPQSHALPDGRGRASPTIAAALTELLRHDVAGWAEHGFVVVKARTVRLVLRGTLGTIPVHVKVFRPDRFADRARDLLRMDRGRVEHDNLLRARQLGLPTVEALGHGFATVEGKQRSCVVTRTVAGEPFTFATAGPGDLAAAGALLRTVHERGMAPNDLHPGNLLVGPDGSLHLLDLTSVHHRGAPALRERARALAFFCHELDGGALDPIARPLLAGYLENGPPLGPTCRSELAAATRRWRAGALPAFGRRSERDCRHTLTTARRRATPQWFWHLTHEDAGAAIDREAFETLAQNLPTPDKTGRRGSVWLLPELAVKERQAAAARRLWRASYWLQFARVACPRPVAMRLHAGRGLVFVERLGRPSLAAELAAGALSPAELAMAATALGTSVGRLHAHGLGNRDLKFENLVRTDRGTVAMVDLDGVRRRPTLDSRGRGADLGRLLAAFQAAGEPGGGATVARFLRAYLRAHRSLLLVSPWRRLRRVAVQRAGEWAEAHRST